MPKVSNPFAQAVLRASLVAGTGYFIAMTTAHFFTLKYPVLFIYWDTPFYTYQDKIISFCAALYALVFFNATRDNAVVPTAVASMFITAIGLSLVNTSDALAEVLRPAMIASIGGWLAYWAKAAGAL